MKIPAFREEEMRVVSVTPASPFMPEFEMFDFPVSERDAVHALFKRSPIWQLSGTEVNTFTPAVYPDNVARAFVFENSQFDPNTQGGGKDIFGVDWVYVPTAMGSMEDPDVPHILEDANDWEEIIHFPDVDSWDWEGSARLNNGTFLNPEKYTQAWIQNGWFERIISFMGFEEASVAMIDDEQKDAVKALLNRISDLYIDVIDHFVKYYDRVDGFYMHDDWGSSQNAFLPPSVVREMLVPPMRKVTDHLHEIGLDPEMHSCGNNIKNVPNMIAAGWDCWIPQAGVNDIDKIYEMYGDQIILGAAIPAFDNETTGEEEQLEIAREYVKKYCDPDKPTRLDIINSAPFLTKTIRREIYRGSRIRYSGGQY